MKPQTRWSFLTYSHEVEFQSTFSNANTIIETIALRTVSNTVMWQVLQAFCTTSSRYGNKSFYRHNPADKYSLPEVRLIFTQFVQAPSSLLSSWLVILFLSSHKSVVVGHFHLASMIHSFQGSWHSETLVRLTDTVHRDFLCKASISYMCTDAKCQQKGLPEAFTANNPISFWQLFL